MILALVRLQKFLSDAGIASRRKSENLILKGKVRVNNSIVTELGTKVDPEVDKVTVDHRPVKALPKGLILLHKPKGYVTTKSDPESRSTVMELVSSKYQSYFPVGRLDFNTTGLLLLTNDGELAETLTHPRYEFIRVYEALLDGSIPEAVLDKISRGIMLEDGPVKARAELIENTRRGSVVSLSLSEGRNRVVRRMMEKLGFPVLELRRIRFGPFTLGRLKVGEVHTFSEKELELYRRKIFSKKLN